MLGGINLPSCEESDRFLMLGGINLPFGWEKLSELVVLEGLNDISNEETQ
jgi:hypothetical protein